MSHINPILMEGAYLSFFLNLSIAFLRLLIVDSNSGRHNITYTSCPNKIELQTENNNVHVHYLKKTPEKQTKML